MSRPLVYLSGPMNGLSFDEADGWRRYATDYLYQHAIGVRSPMRGKGALRGVNKLGEHPDIVNCDSRAITQRDRYDVRTCDAMLVYFNGATSISVGTMIELGWADAFRVPVVVAYEDEPVDGIYRALTASEETILTHPIVKGIAGWIVPSLDEALEIVRTILSED